MNPASATSSLPSINRGPAPMHIAIERPNLAPRHRQRAFTNPSSVSTPAISIIPGIAIPASTPAILPDLDSFSKSASASGSGFQSVKALRTGPLSAIPQSPIQPAGSPVDGPAKGDYFSIRRKPDTSPARGDDKGPPTPGGTLQSMQTPLQTPGGSFMGKLKGLGKKKPAETIMSTVVEAQEAPPEDTARHVYKCRKYMLIYHRVPS